MSHKYGAGQRAGGRENAILESDLSLTSGGFN